MSERIFEPDKATYPEFKAAQYPGFKLRGSDELTADLNEAKKTLHQRREAFVKACRETGYSSKRTIAAQGLLDEAEAKQRTLEKAITSGSAFTDQSIEDRPYIPGEVGFSFADLSGRQTIDANRVRVPMDQYTNTAAAQIVEEGGSAERVSLTASLSLLKTDSTEAIIFDDIQEVSEGVYRDDRSIMTTAIDSAHTRAMVNAENKKALEILTGSKEAIAVSAENVQEAINAHLSGKGKRNAVIITNHSGFAELDIDVNGVSLITRNMNGDLVYKHKYVVQEIEDAILPDNADGSSPILIGDFAHVLKFFMIRDDALIKEDVFPATVADRKIRKEIITLSTKSDDAYIIGYLK